MNNQRYKIRTFLAFAGGALLGFIVEIAIHLSSTGSLDNLFDRQNYPHLISGAIVGAVLIGLVDIAREQIKLLNESMDRLEKIRRALKYEERALSMLLQSGNFSDLMSQFIDQSIDKHFKSIPYVDSVQYINYLKQALKNSDSYQGVQRKPVRWFKEKDASHYLQKLKDQPMAEKIRIFVIDSHDENDMVNDLADSQIMDWYWENTGTDVSTYWITTEQLIRQYKDLHIPDDYAIYNHKLLIEYDEATCILSFDLIQDSLNEVTIFQKLREQILSGESKPFVQLVAPKLPKNRIRKTP